MRDRIYTVVFLCTGDGARSILAELGTRLREIGHLDGSTFERPQAG